MFIIQTYTHSLQRAMYFLLAGQVLLAIRQRDKKTHRSKTLLKQTNYPSKTEEEVQPQGDCSQWGNPCQSNLVRKRAAKEEEPQLTPTSCASHHPTEGTECNVQQGYCRPKSGEDRRLEGRQGGLVCFYFSTPGSVIERLLNGNKLTD